MPKTVVILIGTNDLTYADCDNTSQDILNAAPGIISRHVSPRAHSASYNWSGTTGQIVSSCASCSASAQYFMRGSTGQLVGSAVCRVTQTVQYIHGNSPKTQIVLVGVLPRGAQYWDKDQAWVWPNRYTDAIAAVNAGYYVSPGLFPADPHVSSKCALQNLRDPSNPVCPG